MEERNPKWRFPGNGGTKKNGLDTADFHTFMNDAASSLAREICQNSNDAHDPSSNKPTIVEFHEFDMETSLIPGASSLQEELKRCYDYWKGENNEIASRVDDMNDLFLSKRISVLRVSDFNTTGLEGVNDFDNEKSPWYSLMHGSGESGKGLSEGGSKGVGKYASFVNSKIRTVFYSTNAKGTPSEEGYEGVAYFCSSKLKDSPIGELTQGIGYYGVDKKNDPLMGKLSFDKEFSRGEKEFGTDIYILGFGGGENWKQDIVSKVLDSFMVAIAYGKLEVKVEDVWLKKSTLNNVVFDPFLIRESLKKSIVSQYTLLMKGDAVVHKTLAISYDDETISEVELFFKRFEGEEQSYATSSCSMVRYPFMKIKDLKGILNSSMTSSALCVIGDGRLTHLLKESENPEHTDWITSRINDPTRRRMVAFLYDELKNKIQQTVLDALKSPDEAETDAAMASKYLPDDEPFKKKVGSEKESELLDTPIITRPKRERTSELNVFLDDPIGNGVGIENMEKNKDGEFDMSLVTGSNEGTGGNNDPGDKEGKGDKVEDGRDAYTRIPMKGVTYRFFCVNKKNGEYMISFTAPLTSPTNELSISMVDESGFPSPIDIEMAKVNDEDAIVKDGKRVILKCVEGERLRVYLKTGLDELFSVEVSLNALR